MEQMRAFHLDLKTSHYKKEYLETLFVRLADNKYTHIVFEIEDKVELECIKGAQWFEAYSKREFSSILDKCENAGLKAIPLIQTLGHMEFLLSHQQYHELREMPNSAYMLCPSKPQSMNYIYNLVTEVYELFKQPEYIHIGADETYHIGSCDECKKRVAETSRSDLYIDHINKIINFVKAKGSRAIAWADMILRYPNSLSKVDKSIIWNDWDYITTKANPDRFLAWGKGIVNKEKFETLSEEIKEAYRPYILNEQGKFVAWGYTDFLLDNGYDVIISPATRSGVDHYFSPAYEHLGNTHQSAHRLLQEKKPLGIHVTSWALRINTLESQWPAIVIPGQTDENDDSFDEMKSKISNLMFKNPDNKFFTAWEKISSSIATTHSYLGVGRDTSYFGPADSLLHLIQSWKDTGDLPAILTSLKEQRQGYVEGQQILEKCDPKNDFKHCIQFWMFAAKAMQVKCDILDCAVKSHDGESDNQIASNLLMSIESLKDQYRQLLSNIYSAGSIERELGLIFGSSLRFLDREAMRGLVKDH